MVSADTENVFMFNSGLLLTNSTITCKWNKEGMKIIGGNDVQEKERYHHCSWTAYKRIVREDI